jgi:hypothetical protein
LACSFWPVRKNDNPASSLQPKTLALARISLNRCSSASLFVCLFAGVHGPGLVRDLHNTEPKPTVGEEPRQTSDSLMISLLIVSAVIGQSLCSRTVTMCGFSCLRSLMFASVYVSSAGVAFSIFWLGVLQRFAAKIIHVCLVANIVVAAVGAIAAFAAGQILMGVVYVIIAALMGVYYYYVRARIPFATAVLHSSIQSIKENGGPIWVVYGLALFQIGWLALWAFIFTAVYHAANRVVTETDPATGAVYQYRVSNGSGLQFLQFFCVLSLFWTCQVLRGIGHVTAGGVVASWWFTPGSPAPTMSSFKRAVTTSLGSICFAALLVALVETTRFLLRSARRDAFREIVDCLLGILERALKWFNMYALATVAIFGDDFLTSAKRTGQLFRAELFTAVINDDLSSTVLVAGSILAGVVAGIVGAVWASAKSVEGWVVCAILSFIVGALVASLAMGVIRSAVTTTFVAWASDPATLSQNRPVEFNRIIEAGQHKYANQGIGAYSGQRV